ncbi:MAG: hypothetical protein HQL52_05520 [Magnetococcales bacterium]|nr:hypothetical protein [Magnetococcales bacterium]
MKNATTGDRFHRPLTRLAAAALLSLTLCQATPAAASNKPLNESSWRPNLSERLIKLPANYLKKAVDQDFSGSKLALAISDMDSQIRLKNQTLNDLKAAVEQSEGEVRTELKHQLLAEKRAFLGMMNSRLDLRRKRVRTAIRVYEDVLKKVNRKANQNGEIGFDIAERQKEVRERFENSVTKVDLKLFGPNPQAEQGRYGREYQKNITAIERLVTAINDHPMGSESDINGQGMDKKGYLRQLIADSETENALVDQEETILGYMAKLVALDAMSLAEEVNDAEFADSDVIESESVTSMVDLFISH